MTGQEAGYQDFLAACRRFWAGPLFRALQRQLPAASDADFAGQVQGHPTYTMFAWFERHLQRMKYSGRWGLMSAVGAQREALLAQVAEPRVPLHLQHDLQPPSYWTDHDIHQHPGGLADDMAGFVYQAATGRGGVVGRPELHERFAQAALAGCSPLQVLDIVCGLGRSTLAFAAAAPGALVTGIDLSASCLRLAAAEAPEALQGRVVYRQADAAATSLPSRSFDLVTSTMLLHELPEPALAALVTETSRLLAPGGIAVHLDFLPPADPLLRLLYEGHGIRNNEPFMRDLARADLVTMHRCAGFGPVEITSFSEADGALDVPACQWRLPWTMIAATKQP